MFTDKFTCGNCKLDHATFGGAHACCGSMHIECPLSELQGHMEKVAVKWEMGRAFSGRWEFYTNDPIPHDEPIRVYPLPLVLSNMIEETIEQRGDYERRQGEEGVQKGILRSLGLEHLIQGMRPSA